MKNLCIPLALSMLACNNITPGISEPVQNKQPETAINIPEARTDTVKPPPALDTADYRRRMLAIANDTTGRWPAKDGVLPLPGAILPYNRIIAYYGNLFSKRMGILGELPKEQMLKKLKGEVEKWQAADSTVTAIPALHYIAVSAQGKPGTGGKYRLRMPSHQIDTIIKWANEINGLAFVDVQVGKSTLQEELPPLAEFLKLPNVHLGIDPEFSMKTGAVPGTKIGTFSAADINFVIGFLSEIVTKNNISPKVLVIHRFTQGMITNYEQIKPTPQVQVVIDMDGFGSKILKKSTWMRYIYREPIQFTGFKLFYKNDNKDKAGMYRPEELVKFTPAPVYIQYQ